MSASLATLSKWLLELPAASAAGSQSIATRRDGAAESAVSPRMVDGGGAGEEDPVRARLTAAAADALRRQHDLLKEAEEASVEAARLKEAARAAAKEGDRQRLLDRAREQKAESARLLAEAEEVEKERKRYLKALELAAMRASHRAEGAGEATEGEAQAVTQSIRRVGMAAAATVVERSRDVADVMGQVAEDAVQSFGSASDAFEGAVGEASDQFAVAANRVAEQLNKLLAAVGSGGGDLASESETGGGAINDEYAAVLLREWVGRYQYNQRSAGDARSDVIRTQAMNDIGMERLEVQWDRIFSRFGRLEDLAMETLRRQTPAQPRGREPASRLRRPATKKKTSARRSVNRRWLP